MAPETLVLDCNKGVDEVLRDLRVGNPDAVVRAVETLILKLDLDAVAVLAILERIVLHVIDSRGLIGV